MNDFKTYMIAILFICLSVVTCTLIYNERAIKPNPIPGRSEIEMEAQIIARKVDKQGLQHVVLQETNRITGMNELSLDAKEEIDSLSKLIEIKDKQLREYYATNLQLKTGLLKAQKEIDSLNRKTYTYKDRFIDAKFFTHNDTSGYFDFTYNAELKHIKYWKKERVFGLPIGAKINYIDIHSSDPRMTISGVKHLVIENKESPWNVRLGATSLNLPSLNVVAFGPRIAVDYLGLGVDAQYLCFPGGQWHPVLNVYYDFLKW